MLSRAAVEHIVQDHRDRGPLRQYNDSAMASAYATIMHVQPASGAIANRSRMAHAVGELLLRGKGGQRRQATCFTDGEAVDDNDHMVESMLFPFLFPHGKGYWHEMVHSLITASTA